MRLVALAMALTALILLTPAADAGGRRGGGCGGGGGRHSRHGGGGGCSSGGHSGHGSGCAAGCGGCYTPVVCFPVCGGPAGYPRYQPPVYLPPQPVQPRPPHHPAPEPPGKPPGKPPRPERPKSEVPEDAQLETTFPVGATEALAEVNDLRAANGLPPFIQDAGLTTAAASAASYRAAVLLEGHTANDFTHLPPGAYAIVAGCAAWPVHYGWGACASTDAGYQYAGAAYAYGRDGRRYMHLFCR